GDIDARNPGEAAAGMLQAGGELGDGIVEARLVDPQGEIAPPPTDVHNEAGRGEASGRRDPGGGPDHGPDVEAQRMVREPSGPAPSFPPPVLVVRPVQCLQLLVRPAVLRPELAARAESAGEEDVEGTTRGDERAGVAAGADPIAVDLEAGGVQDAGEDPAGGVDLALLDPPDGGRADVSQPCQLRTLDPEFTPDRAHDACRLHHPSCSRRPGRSSRLLLEWD